MRKLLLVGATAALGATACAPEVENQAPADVVVAQFDPTGVPAVVPSPNDLAIDTTTGLVKAPIDPNASPAMQEFTRDYLNTLNGFPTASPATAKIVDLDPSTINPQSVRFIDMYAGTPIATAPVTPTITYDDATDTLRILPPATGWPKGARYAVALVGGENGLKGTNGRPLVGSATWAFARSPEPLVTCEDLTAPNCQTATELIPSTETDPAARLADQTASALRLEQLRRAYKPLLEALENQGVKREDVALMWTFSIVNQPEATFDLTRSIIPFPNDLLRRNGRLALPTAGLTGDTLALYEGLNTLDGWSTTAPIVSENSNELGVLEPGSRLDANTLATGTKFLKLTNPTTGTQPNVTACLNCASSVGASGTPAGPQQLQFVPQTPLDEKTQYAALLTTDLKDERGRRVMAPALFALVRMANPLVDANGKSTVSVISDAQANLLEPVRQGFKPLFDGLEAGAKIPRSKIALGWAFTTQSTVSVLKALNALPAQYGQATPVGLPKAPVYFQDVTAGYRTVVPNGNVFVGSAYFPLALTGPAGTLNPAAPVTQRAPFLLVVPNSASVTGNIPVTIFSHGLTGNRNNVLGIANTLAASGRAVIAIDTVFHGERANCAAISATSPVLGLDNTTLFTAPDQACNDPETQKCDVDPKSGTFGRCIAKTAASRQACTPFTYAGDATCKSLRQGVCLPTGATTGVCEGGDFKRTDVAPTHSNYDVPLIGGSILNLSNLFATRDNFRHHVIDTAQLVRVLSAPEFDAIKDINGDTLPVTIDETKIDYLGQSLGGILGGLSVPVTPEIRKAVLNVPSADPVGVLQTSQTPRFAQARTQFYGRLASQGLPLGTPAFDAFINIARTIMDPADPQNAAYELASSQATAGRSVFIQYAEGDDVTPNPTTEKLINAANRNTAHPVAVTKFTFADANTYPLASRHGFLFGTAGTNVAQVAQTQVVTFFATGAVPAAETKF
jgi:hypothetical protein